MSITHFQETRCYCCQCRENVVLDRLIIPDGGAFLRVRPESYGWKKFVWEGVDHYLCPKHTLDIHVVVDEKAYEPIT